ncbi:MAG: RraA family protein [Planctomycetes bacterium]|nr:RraA family protein [Planctomycetota bacterium]
MAPEEGCPLVAVPKAEREEILKAYADLRVADVRDGMDTMMLHPIGSMRPEIRPLWRTHACGIARTCRYLPFDGAIPPMTPEEYWKWVGRYYKEVCPYPWMDDVQPGDFCVIDQSGVNAGLMGSNNSLNGFRKGARGYVTSGGVRDTDELILQKIPFWSAMCSQSMVQGRLRFDAKDVPVSVGGVLVHPGDVVVADGDGVIVVPRSAALEVARHAAAEHKRDKAGRRKLYEQLGRELDETVKD